MSTQYPVYNNRPIDQWKVTELKEELCRRNLKRNGLKEELVRRLDKALRKEMTGASEKELNNGFDPDSDSQNNVHEDDLEQTLAENKTQHVEDPSKKVDNDAAMVDVGDITSDANEEAKDDDQTKVGDTNMYVAIEDTSVDVLSLDKHVTDDQNVVTNLQSMTANTNLEIDVALHKEMTAASEKELNNGFDPDSDPQNNVTEDDLKQTLAENKTQHVEDPSKKVDYDAAMVDVGDITSDANEEAKDDQTKVGDTSIDVSIEDTSVDAVPLDKYVTDDQNVVTSLQSNDQKPSNDETRDSKLPAKVTELTAPDSANQVSEVSTDLEFQVKCESISTDSVSIKDNLNANNVNLELEVVKMEMVQSSPSDFPTAGVNLHPIEDDKELLHNQGSLEDVGDATCTTVVELSKKVASIDGGSPEKLNLDRSSGDESMEDDVLESKQIESKSNHDEVGERSGDSKAELVQVANPVDSGVGEFPPEKKGMTTGDEIKPTASVEKRKTEDQETLAIIEPKRQRRWNLETIKAPEPQTSSLIATLPKDAFQPSLKRSLSRNESSLSGEAPKERVVPPPLRAATTSLRINNFLRPFTLKAVQELLAKTGTLSDFWMDHIKTHCYVTYSSVEEAVATRNAVYNHQWPTNGGRLLTAEFVNPEEVKLRLDAPQSSSAPVTPSPTTPIAPQFQPETLLPPPRHQSLRGQLPPPPPLLSNPPPVREGLLPPPPLLQKPEPPIVTLDDLFKKTKAVPRIYYLPLSEEQVAVKLSVRGKAKEGQ